MRRYGYAVLVMAMLAGLTVGLAGCTKTQQGAVAGSTAGAVIGYQTGDNHTARQRNAVIGGVLGGAAGGYVGHEMDMVKYCPECGREYREEDRYCSVDGTELLYKE